MLSLANSCKDLSTNHCQWSIGNVNVHDMHEQRHKSNICVSVLFDLGAGLPLPAFRRLRLFLRRLAEYVLTTNLVLWVRIVFFFVRLVLAACLVFLKQLGRGVAGAAGAAADKAGVYSLTKARVTSHFRSKLSLEA